MKLQITDLPIVDSIVTVDPAHYQCMTTEDKAFVDATIRDAGLEREQVASVEYLARNVETFTLSNGEQRQVFKRDELTPSTLTLRIT